MKDRSRTILKGNDKQGESRDPQITEALGKLWCVLLSMQDNCIELLAPDSRLEPYEGLEALRRYQCS